MKKFTLVVVLLFCASMLFNDALFAKGHEYDKQTVLIKFKQGITKAQKQELSGLLKGKFKDKNNDGIDDRYHKIAKGRVARIDLDGSGGDPHEGNGHGSHCAGTIGAVGNNGKGVVGVNWSVSIMGLRFLSNTGSGTTADAIESILGFSNPVNLSASSDPAINATISFTPNPGTPGSTSTMNVVTSLSTATGYYTITVTGVSGSITKTTSVDLEVVPEGGYPNNPPVANFSTSKNNLKVTFTDTSTDSDGTIVAWDWNFGDGAASTVQDPVHTYGSSGTYTVTLTVTDDDNGTDTISKNVTVNNQNEQ
jgi:chitodextrinase